MKGTQMDELAQVAAATMTMQAQVEQDWLEFITAADALCVAVQEYAEHGSSNRYFAMIEAAEKCQLAREKLDHPMVRDIRPGSDGFLPRTPNAPYVGAHPGWGACWGQPERPQRPADEFKVDL